MASILTRVGVGDGCFAGDMFFLGVACVCVCVLLPANWLCFGVPFIEASVRTNQG